MESNKFFNRINIVYASLKCNFWSTDNNIKKSYIDIMQSLNDSLERSKDDQENEKTPSLIENLLYSYGVLTHQQEKENYIHFLFINFILSQPNTLEKLQTNFKNFIFPFYIFILKSEGSNISADYTVLDFMKFSISFYLKSKLIRGITGETIILLTIHKNTIKINLKNTNEVIYFKCGIKQQTNYIFSLLLFLKQSAEKLIEAAKKEINLNITYTKNDIEEVISNAKQVEKSFKFISKFRYHIFIHSRLLVDDRYLPTGVILRANIKKEHNIKSLTNSNRFIVLGNSTIIIFKDETMTTICNVIPIVNFNIIFEFLEETLVMKILVADRKYKIWFRSIDEYQIWQSTICDMSECHIKEKIDDNIIPMLLEGGKFTHKDESLKEIKEGLNKKIEILQEKLCLLVKIKEELGRFEILKIDEKNFEKN